MTCKTPPVLSLFASGAVLLTLVACGGDPAETTEAAPDQSAVERTEAPQPEQRQAAVQETAPDIVDGFVRVDGVDMPLADISCGPVGGGSTWRVAAAFDIIPENRDRYDRYYFDVRSIVDEEGQAAPRSRTGQPDVTLQFPREDGPTPDAFMFFTADSRFRGGNTLELDFSTAGSSGTIDVQRQYVQAYEVSEEGPEPELKTVEYELNCP